MTINKYQKQENRKIAYTFKIGKETRKGEHLRKYEQWRHYEERRCEKSGSEKQHYKIRELKKRARRLQMKRGKEVRHTEEADCANSTSISLFLSFALSLFLSPPFLPLSFPFLLTLPIFLHSAERALTTFHPYTPKQHESRPHRVAAEFQFYIPSRFL